MYNYVSGGAAEQIINLIHCGTMFPLIRCGTMFPSVSLLAAKNIKNILLLQEATSSILQAPVKLHKSERLTTKQHGARQNKALQTHGKQCKAILMKQLSSVTQRRIGPSNL